MRQHGKRSAVGPLVYGEGLVLHVESRTNLLSQQHIGRSRRGDEASRGSLCDAVRPYAVAQVRSVEAGKVLLVAQAQKRREPATAAAARHGKQGEGILPAERVHLADEQRAARIVRTQRQPYDRMPGYVPPHRATSIARDKSSMRDSGNGPTTCICRRRYFASSSRDIATSCATAASVTP